MRAAWGAIRFSKLLCDRDPVKGEELASQPTLSRFENSVDRADLYRMGVALADTVIERHRRRLKRKAKRITIDLDPTDDPTHGAQQLTFFNGHYDTWCYLPVAGFLTFNEESEQYLFAYVLRPGNVGASVGALGILSRLLPKLRAAFPRARLRVRLGRWLCRAGDLRLSRARRTRIRRRDGQKQGSRAARGAPDGHRPTPVARIGRDRASLQRVPLCGRNLGSSSACHHQGRSRAPSRAASRRTIRASWSPTSSNRLGICMKRSTATAPTSRIGSRNCTTAWRSTAPAAPASSPTSCAHS